MWAASSFSSSSGSGSLRWRLPSPIASADTHAHHVSEEHNQPQKLRFPFKAAFTAGVLALLGDTIAQVRSQWVFHRHDPNQRITDRESETIAKKYIDSYDWMRALRMTSYGFFIYGPSSQIWYIFLDHILRDKTLRNLTIKVTLNQLVLGPYVIAVVFAWNSLWQGKLDKLPALYHDSAFPTLVDGWKFWIPASVLNFGVVPLQARVAFMSSCSIFWNFYLSTTMGKA